MGAGNADGDARAGAGRLSTAAGAAGSVLAVPPNPKRPIAAPMARQITQTTTQAKKPDVTSRWRP